MKTIETNQQNIFNSFNTFVVTKVIAKSIVKISFLFDWGVISAAGPPLNWSLVLQCAQRCQYFESISNNLAS